MKSKEDDFNRKLDDQQRKFEAEQKQKERMAEKKELLLGFKQDVEPLIAEANEIAQQMSKEIRFSLQFTSMFKETDNLDGDRSVDELLKARKDKLEVKVEDYQNN